MLTETDDGRYLYSEGDKTVTIAKWQYETILRNPCAYYFSTAVKVHLTCQAQSGFDFTYLTINNIKSEIKRITNCKSDNITNAIKENLYRAFVQYVAAHSDKPKLVEKAKLMISF